MSNKPDEEIESDGPNEAPKSTKVAKTSKDPAKPKTDGKSGKQPFSDCEAEEAVAGFMEKNNRPYSVQDVLNSF